MSIRDKYKIYRNSKCIVIDSVPRIFKANSRKDYEHIGTVCADDVAIRIFQVSESIIEQLSRDLSKNDIVFLPMTPGEYVTWSEQTERSSAEITGLLCISDKVRLVLNKPIATRIQELEVMVAKAIRKKGDEKQIILHKVKHELLDLHFDKVDDPRMEVLASAIGLKLPHRGKHKREGFLGNIKNDYTKVGSY